MSEMSRETSNSHDCQQPLICGFIPPYILEAIAGSNKQKVDDARIACQQALNHSHVFQKKRAESYAQAHAPAQAQRAVQQTLGAAGHGAATGQIKIYDCRKKDDLPGTLVRNEGQKRSEDRQVNNCYDAFKITRDFYSAIFGRNSLDGEGLPLIGSIHYQLEETPDGFDNAFWHGDRKQMVFGDGDGIMFDYLTDSLDVVAHELTHGFVQFSSPLTYEGQSGALNESCADVFACMVEQWHMSQTPAEADWNLGQTIFPVAFKGCALRTMKVSKAFVEDPIFGTDPQPKHMDDLYNGSKDRKGVHINSGIPNHAFYLAATSLEGKSWEQAGQVWYKTMTSGRIPHDCDFKTFANVTVGIAGEAFSGDASVESKIRDAWVKVGVL